MFVGTGSDVGKSVINTAFCRIFLQDGYQPAPFKAQNMSLNSYATPDGLEIGRAQAVQAEACGIPCGVEMNPVLLKPTSDCVSQMVLHGKPAGNKSAMEYFNETNRDWLFNEVMQSYQKLSAKHNPIVIEGAGSISEINLWDKDITNMCVAEAVNAATILIADIDRGGIFASLYGSIQLLPAKQRKLIKGILINKFRGDERLFYEGRSILEKLCGIPVIGIIPWFRDIFIEQEDSVVLDHLKNKPQPGKINIGIVRLKHMSNFTDFDTLQHVPEVNLFYASSVEDLKQSDIIIIPGSKNTIADMNILHESGFASAIKAHHRSNQPLYGICGGYQMMGHEILDPFGVEGENPRIEGLGIMPVSTTLGKNKTTKQCRFKFVTNSEITGSGYEIHMGTSTHSLSPLCNLNTSETDGCYLNPKTWGSYIHGIFDNATVIEHILQQVQPNIKVTVSYRDIKENGYNQLAKLVRQQVNMDYIYKTLHND
jgi:adenosylcobyric acid synthase